MKVYGDATKNMRLFFLICVFLVSIFFVNCSTLLAVDNEHYTAVPPFSSTEVKPNVLIIIDNSNSMDEDLDGLAVGSDSPLSRSEIARNAIKEIIERNQFNVRFGLMAYNQEDIEKRYVHSGFYYASYSSSTYDASGTSTPKDPTSNTKRYVNPTSASEYIYYDQSLPFYANGSMGSGFCYSDDYTEDANISNDHYNCYSSKSGDTVTPSPMPVGDSETDYGYSSMFWNNTTFSLTDSDIAAGFDQIGYEMAWAAVGDTWFSNSSPGGGVLHVDVADSSPAHISAINAKLATSQFTTETDTPLRNAGLTPLSGTLDSALRYFEGDSNHVDEASGVTATNPIELLCQENFVILVTDGLPSVDSDGNPGDADTLLAEVESSIAALRSTVNTDFSGSKFDIKTYVVGFSLPEGSGSKLDDLAVAGGTDENGHALVAEDATELGAALSRIFRDIDQRVSSGSAASVISNSRSGEGVVYQSVFYPEYIDSNDKKVNWAGNVFSLFVDAYGNLREDTNSNNRLDVKEIDLDGNGSIGTDEETDYIVVYRETDSGTVVDRYKDNDENEALDRGEDINCNGVLDPGEDTDGDSALDSGLDTCVDTVTPSSVNYIWQANEWLNEISDTDVVQQRTYSNTDDKRYLFTFLDSDGDKVVDSGEVYSFVESNYDDLAAPIIEFVHKSDEPDYVAQIRLDSNYADYREQQSKRTINFIRGKDQPLFTSATATPYTLNAMRNRVVDYDEDGTDETWRLGDIIHSSPKIVGRPAERYHLLYNDYTYAQFADKYEHRRNVVYVGGNDGMIHAFNGGFFDNQDNSVKLQSPNNSESQYDLGSELWAYLPYNLLPHLRWLTSPDYMHVYYNDLQAKVVDAQIFTEESECQTDIYDAACIHPNGWGTLLIAGMRFGGGEFPRDATWDFGTDADGWAFSDNSVTEGFNGEAWTIETSNGIGNPNIVSPDNLDIDASKIKTISVRFLTTAQDAGSGGARLYWDDNGNGVISNGNSQTINAPAVDVSGEYYVYTFDMSDNPNWAGTVNKIRLDPQGAFTSGSSIAIDYVDLGDGKGFVSSYVLMDVTNPEIAPTVLAEVNLLGLGYTTSTPAVIPLKSKTDSNKNDWYMVFGSGPNYNNLASPYALTNADSNTQGEVFVLSLSDLISQNMIRMVNDSGSLVDGAHLYSLIDDDSYVSDFITVDFDKDYDADAVYFGTVSGNEIAGWGGKMRRIVLNEGDTDITTWTKDSTLYTLDNDRSVTAKPSIAIDDFGNNWVYFGSGRYFTRDDIEISATQNYFGIKEPVDSNGAMTWAEVNSSSLLDTTYAEVYDDLSVDGLGTGLDTWSELITEVDNNKSGWKIDLQAARERSLSQAAVLGGIVTFTSYQPSSDLCLTEGSSSGYGLYYKTGTAYYKSVFGYDLVDTNSNQIADVLGEKKIKSKFHIGEGLSSTPAIHTGRGKGSTAFIQTSQGTIFKIEEENPGLTKSGKVSWGQLR